MKVLLASLVFLTVAAGTNVTTTPQSKPTSPYNITMTATLSNGETYPIAALREGAGFSMWFTYGEEIYYEFDTQEGLIYEPVSDFRYIMDITSQFTESTDEKAAPMIFQAAGNSSVFWSWQRPTAGPCKLKGVISETGEQVWFYAGMNYTYDPYGYSQDHYFIGASTKAFWELELDGVTEIQGADVRVMVAGVAYDLC